MTFPEARKVLGLGPDEDPRPHLEEFKAARERIAEMVRGAPNETLGLRYQQGLMEFDQALAAVYEHLEILGLSPKRERITEDMPVAPPAATEPAREESVRPAAKPATSETPDDVKVEAAPRRSRAPAFFLWFLVFLIGGVGGALLYVKNERDKELRRMARITYLEREGAVFIDNRRWQDAEASFDEIERLDPGSEIARMGRRSIEAGMAEEQKQFIGYWTGQAIAELDAGRIDEADAAIRQITSRFPNEAEAAPIVARIAEARDLQSRDRRLDQIRALIAAREWDQALASAGTMLTENQTDEDAKALLAEAESGRARHQENLRKAADLYEQAKQKDAGRFDQEALDWLREAVSLDPENGEIRGLFEKMSSYTRTLRIPDDFATPAEALAEARENDRIVLGEGSWKGPLVLTAGVVFEGTEAGKTIIECPPDGGSALTIGPDCKGARISGITIRHESIQLTGNDRFSAALVRGGAASFIDCRFIDASGHGLAVIEKGEALVQRCEFRDNGWNGAAAIGDGAVLEVRESESTGNFENGFEAWNGAALTLVRNRCSDNSRNGIHVDTRSATAQLQGNQLSGNREFGIVLSSAGGGEVVRNIARGNLLGGIVIRRPAASLTISGNEAASNQGPGLVLETGVSPDSIVDNKVSKNKGGEVIADINLGPEVGGEDEPER
ncbi:MAG: right-handed parallel beta-helix repeat-containing protein [Akkermansiaceae bacterium]|nr:right-handed parallel beta-helix repeat-containing protein [Akkermansiaceae bacterium]